MTNKIFSSIYHDALSGTCLDRDAFISDWVLSSVWGTPETYEIPQERISQVGQIWDAANIPLSELRARTGLTQLEFCAHFSIPRRTWENWESCVTTCPSYIRLLLAHAVGIIDINSLAH